MVYLGKVKKYQHSILTIRGQTARLSLRTGLWGPPPLHHPEISDAGSNMVKYVFVMTMLSNLRVWMPICLCLSIFGCLQLMWSVSSQTLVLNSTSSQIINHLFYRGGGKVWLLKYSAGESLKLPPIRNRKTMLPLWFNWRLSGCQKECLNRFIEQNFLGKSDFAANG